MQPARTWLKDSVQWRETKSVNLEHIVLRKVSEVKCCPWTKCNYAWSQQVLLCTAQSIPDTSQLSSTEGQWYTTQGHLPPFLLFNRTGVAWHICWQPKPCLGFYLWKRQQDWQRRVLWLTYQTKETWSTPFVHPTKKVEVNSCYYGTYTMRNCVSAM